MTFKLMFKYLLGVVVIILVFAQFSWRRTENILKNYIVEQALNQLHYANVAKLDEIESKIKLYQQASEKIYERMLVRRESYDDEQIDTDIVGADLFEIKNNKHILKASYANTVFLKNRDLGNDFFKETLGANPLNFASLQYNKYFVQRLNGNDGKTNLLAIVTPLTDVNSVMVVYVDLIRFQNLFAPVTGFRQVVFEPINGVLSTFGENLTETDYNEHPAVVKLNKSNKTVLQSKFKIPQENEFFYVSLIRSVGGFYALTEAPESFLFKSIYLLKSNHVQAVGILLSALVAVMAFIGLFTSQKSKYVQNQLESYKDNRELALAYTKSVLPDEIDHLSHQVRSAFAHVEKSIALSEVLKKFSNVNLGEKINFKKVDLNISKSKAMIARIELRLADIALVDDVILLRDYDEIRSAVEDIVARSSGAIISHVNTSITLAWGLFDDNPQCHLRGLNAILDIEAMLKTKTASSSGVTSYMICASQGDVVTHLSSLEGKHELLYFGHIFDEINQLGSLKFALDQNIVATKNLAMKSDQYFNFDPEFKFSIPTNTEAYEEFRLKVMRLDVVRLSHKTREIISTVN